MRNNHQKNITRIFILLTISNIIFANFASAPHPIKQIMRSHMDSSPAEAFKVWHYLHKREYKLDSTEGLRKYKNFKNNFEIVNNHNKKEEQSYTVGLNNFADMTIQEFKEKYLVTNGRLYSQIKRERLNKTDLEKVNFWDLPEEDEDAYMELFLNKKNINLQSSYLNKDFHTVDWSEKAQLNRKVENQEHCGSCWAFSTIQAIQAAYSIKTGKSISLSKQQLIDCDKTSKGCNGGMIHTAMDYVKKNGIKLEEDYPYYAADSECQIKSNELNGDKIVTKISSYEGCIDKDDCSNDLGLFDVLTRGPVAAVVDASEEFMLYDEGIFDKPCKEANHAILLTGYFNHPKNNTSYWVVKNSWGPLWGDHGFIKIKQSKDYNSCLLNTYYVRPDI